MISNQELALIFWGIDLKGVILGTTTDPRQENARHDKP